LISVLKSHSLAEKSDEFADVEGERDTAESEETAVAFFDGRQGKGECGGGDY